MPLNKETNQPNQIWTWFFEPVFLRQKHLHHVPQTDKQTDRYIQRFSLFFFFFQKLGITSILQKAFVATPQASFNFSVPAVHMTNKRTVIGFYINSVYSNLLTLTCCKLTDFVLQLTWITCRLLRKCLVNSDFERMVSWDLIRLASPAVDNQTPLQMLKTLYGVKMSQIESQVLFPEFSFQDWMGFKWFTTIAYHFFDR